MSDIELVEVSELSGGDESSAQASNCIDRRWAVVLRRGYMNLNKQVFIYSIDTSAFYNKKELELHNQLNKIAISRRELKKRLEKSSADDLADIKSDIKDLTRDFNAIKGRLCSLFAENTDVRELNDGFLKPSNVVPIFDGVLSRTLGMEKNQLYTDIFIVRAYFFDIIEDIMLDGFTYNNEKYIFFTASAGQIRTKKAVFIKYNLWQKVQSSIMCGLTVEEINNLGGINVNKFLAYLALCNGATEKIEERRLYA